MTLPYMTHFPKGLERIGGQPTNFIPKLWLAMLNGIAMNAGQYTKMFALLSEADKELLSTVKPKIHTFREDHHDRWQPGTLIHSVIHNRTPQRLQFLPTIPCAGTQKVHIHHYSKEMYGDRPSDIHIDNIRMTPQEVEQMAFNDGFECVQDFFAYFNKDWKGKIIHLTELRY